MRVIRQDNLRILIADENKHIRAIDDVYRPATEDEPEHIPYYATKIYLAINFDETKIDDYYVEESIEEE